MATVNPVSTGPATDATPTANANGANAATTPPPALARAPARMFLDQAEEDERRLRVLVTLRKPNLAFAMLAARALALAARGTPARMPALPASVFAAEEPAHV